MNFPEFMFRAQNKIPASQQNTPDIKGYYYTANDGARWLSGSIKQILLWALEHMKTERVILHVADWNRRAIELYKKTGFEITGKG